MKIEVKDLTEQMNIKYYQSKFEMKVNDLIKTNGDESLRSNNEVDAFGISLQTVLHRADGLQE